MKEGGDTDAVDHFKRTGLILPGHAAEVAAFRAESVDRNGGNDK